MHTRTTTVIDPRPPAGAPPTRLARRARELDRQRIVLWDNGKLRPEFGQYRAVFDQIQAVLARKFPGMEVVNIQDDLLVGGLDRLDGLVSDLAANPPGGIIFALCDTGVSQPTTILASKLEAVGIPTSLVCQGIGLRVSAGTAAVICPGLPMVGIQAIRTSSYEEISKEIDPLIDTVLGGLTDSEDLLHQRFASHGAVVSAHRSADGVLQIEGDDVVQAFTAVMAESGLGDGFPLIAPIRANVEALLQATELDPNETIWPQTPPRATPVTAWEVATVAAMAGCRPAHMRIVMAAYRAMGRPEFRLFQAAITTHPSGTLVLVSGPEATKAGVESGPGSLGPGFPANAAIGRAVALSYSFLLGARPGASDLTLQGSPAEYSYCCAENLAQSPWPGLNAERCGPDQSTVTVLKCEGPHNVLDNLSMVPDHLLVSIASKLATLGGNNAYNPAQSIVFLNPEHARIIAQAGWSKQDVRQFLFDTARLDRQSLEGRGITPIWPPWYYALDRIPIVRTPDDLLVVVTGGGGPQSQVAIPWGYSRGVTAVI